MYNMTVLVSLIILLSGLCMVDKSFKKCNVHPKKGKERSKWKIFRFKRGNMGMV